MSLQKIKRILFVVNQKPDVIGGHLISAVSLAASLVQRGYEVGVLLPKLRSYIPELHQPNLRLHEVPAVPGLQVLLFFQKIASTVRQYQYDAIVAMDLKAIFQVVPTLLRSAPLLVQVQPGGTASKRPYFKQPGILVFSEEIRHHLVSNCGIVPEHIVLSTGRVNFKNYQSLPSKERALLSYREDTLRLLTISRLVPSKVQAINHLFDEVEEVGKSRRVDLIVIGDGEVRHSLEKRSAQIHAATQGNVAITFLGAFRVTANELQQPDIVIGQGRTAVEGIAAGTPVAISGSDGYFGLIRLSNLSELISTNLTGRNIAWRGHLLDDLELLDRCKSQEFSSVQEQMFRQFDVSQGAVAVEKALMSLSYAYPNVTSLRRQYLRAAFSDLLPSAAVNMPRELITHLTHLIVKAGRCILNRGTEANPRI